MNSANAPRLHSIPWFGEYRPVMNVARDGPHNAYSTTALLNSVPPANSRSVSVRTGSRWAAMSSTMITTTFGRGSAATVGG